MSIIAQKNLAINLEQEMTNSVSNNINKNNFYVNDNRHNQ